MIEVDGRILEELRLGTEVLFPDGVIEAKARVVGVLPLKSTTASQEGQEVAVILDRTPFHPVDDVWPDQPQDEGSLSHGIRGWPLTRCLTAAIDAEGRLYFGDDVPKSRQEREALKFLVAHVGKSAGAPVIGDEVVACVDSELRRELSASHTACHLVALALNAALARYWRKTPSRLDSLGNPDFDSIAIQSSKLTVKGSRDVYRLGKSLRKAGFYSEGLLAALPDVASSVNSWLLRAIHTGAAVEIAADGPLLKDRRRWICKLPTGPASMHCGGTHLSSLRAFSRVLIEIEYSDEKSLLTIVTSRELDDAAHI